MNYWGTVALVLMLLSSAMPVQAEPTRITVTVRSKDAKFIGTGMGGALVTIRSVDNGELLAKGVTVGTTGNTERIMRPPVARGAVLSDELSARYTAEIDIGEPTLLEIRALGPLAQRQAAASVAITQWAVPGKHLTTGDGVLLELPGLALDILSPPAHTVIDAESLPATVEIRAHVVMMCGCPITPGGLWDAGKYEVKALLKKDGKPFAELPLDYAGDPSMFRGSLDVKTPGAYQLTVYAFNPATGNTGVDSTTIVVQ